MPTNYINSLSKEHKIPVKKLEEIWEKAKQASSNKNNYGIITTIFKSMINKQFDLNENKKEVNLFIINKTMYMEENEKIKLQIGDSIEKIVRPSKQISSSNSIIKKNDFLFSSSSNDNFSFATGDGRILKFTNTGRFQHLKISKDKFKSLDLSNLKLIKKTEGNYYYF